MQVLFVCTANMCRSPMAAALFDQCRVTAGRGDAAALSIRSAGLLVGGYSSPPEVVSVLAELGLNLSAHTSTQISPELVASSDMIVGMARRHARDVVLLDPGAFSRTFTLKDLVRRGDLVGPRAAGEGLGDWMARLHRGRQRTDLVGASPGDDVPDPLGGSLDDFRVTARELSVLVEHLAGLLWADRPVRTSPG